MFSRGKDLVRHAVPFTDLVRLRQKFHRKMNPFELPARDCEIARLFGATGQQNGIEIAPQIACWHICANMRVDDELYAFEPHLCDPAIDQVLLHLEIRDAVTEQPSYAIGFFKYGNGMSRARQLLRRGKSRGPGT